MSEFNPGPAQIEADAAQIHKFTGFRPHRVVLNFDPGDVTRAELDQIGEMYPNATLDLHYELTRYKMSPVQYATLSFPCPGTGDEKAKSPPKPDEYREVTDKERDLFKRCQAFFERTGKHPNRIIYLESAFSPRELEQLGGLFHDWVWVQVGRGVTLIGGADYVLDRVDNGNTPQWLAELELTASRIHRNGVDIKNRNIPQVVGNSGVTTTHTMQNPNPIKKS